MAEPWAPYRWVMTPALTLPGRDRSGLLLELDLTRGLLEAAPKSPIAAARNRHVPVLRRLVEAIDRASGDDRVVGLVAHIGGRLPTLAQVSEIRAAVQRMHTAGKATVCWAETFGELGGGTLGYHLATGFGEIWLQESGELAITGIVAQAVFLHDAFENLGMTPQMGQRYEYKTAANALMETTMTEAHREMTEALVSSAADTVIADIAAARGMDADAVQAAIDDAPMSAQQAHERALVDHVGYRRDVYAALAERFGDPERLLLERHRRSPAETATEAIQRLPLPGRSPRPRVAIVQATGQINLGRSSESPLTGRTSIGSDTICAALRAVGRDDSVKAVVLRVDSPGGSYPASDAVRDEVLALRATGRPVVASMGSVAGSGGYFIAMPADLIVADAGTLTGSIGVLGGKVVTQGAFDKLGIGRESVARGKHAEMVSAQRPFTDEEWERLDEWLDRVYADFTAKAASDRGMSLADLQAVARGRVWSGADAHERGLVDEIGGLDTAVDLACKRADIDRAEADVALLPRLGPIDRIRPPRNTDSPNAAMAGAEMSLEGEVLARLGIAAPGVLTMPVLWRLQ